MALTQVAMSVSPDEKALIEAAAAKEGVTLSVFMYRRVFNQPDAKRDRGRKPRNGPRSEQIGPDHSKQEDLGIAV